MSDGSYFSANYATARDRFRRAVTDAGGGLDALHLSARGPEGNELTVDIGWFGAGSPRKVLLHVSGIHGVEAFAGSAIQLLLIERLPEVPDDTAIVFVHVLNPYGMAWLRRFNENNVDLNRNFLPDGERYAGHAEGYENLYGLLNPTKLPRLDLFVVEAAWQLVRHGRSQAEAAVVAGQYDYPQGLFFGGNELQEGNRLYLDFLRSRMGHVEAVFAIDVHTGLGRFGEDTVLVAKDEYPRLRRILGERVQSFSGEGGSVAYEIRGGHHEGVARWLRPAHVDFVGQEFGTYGQIRVLGALRKENYAHHYGDPSLNGPHKRNLKAAFAPDDPDWRRRVLMRGRDLFEQALAILADEM